MTGPELPAPGPGSGPWYREFFTEPFWAVAGHEYTAERTAAEVDYLAAVLDGSAPGRRVLDLGCGTGRHAVGLAGRGFRVTGVDVGAWALDRAAEAAAAAGVRVDWLRLDLLRELPWPVGEFDAVLCVQSFGWGTDAQQLRLLRRVRRVLAPDGVLLLDHSNLLAITADYRPRASFETEGLRAEFRRSLRVLTGRSAGQIEVRRDGLPTELLSDDVRLYQPAEVGDLLTRAGFTVERADAGFVVGQEVTAATRYVQFLARRTAGPGGGAGAIALWSHSRAEAGLDLRWTPDEAEFVDGPVRAAFQGMGPDQARAYHLTDPFAGEQSAPVLAEHFGMELTPDMVTAGAGATGLLQALAGLAAPGPVLHLAGGHPDLPRWAADLGAETVLTSPDRLTADLDRCLPSMLVLDRPSLAGELADREAVAELAAVARARGTVLVVDEAYANYAGPEASCAPLVAEHGNLVVLRSISKAYCCGGLRVGFALAAPELTRWLREFAPPLAANSHGLAVALRLLSQGDVLGGLRARIAQVKPGVAAALRRVGLDPTEGDPRLPWVTAPADTEALAVVERLGIRVKLIDGRLLKIAVPLSEARLAAFRALLPERDADPRPEFEGAHRA
ncbi:aminotransferase class I/II-fold pyridoxal phosphate-dependent enzyme [Streptacidiphilus sp. N1-10]|uniref:Aminotransferase class I/II-fold pyridoxal phosphate-dependent enzyme n=1 Tax=Streptacidiphilus jeojiensis TaxID=3229225 RepID=A0ABV6XX03_9ACTN